MPIAIATPYSLCLTFILSGKWGESGMRRIIVVAAAAPVAILIAGASVPAIASAHAKTRPTASFTFVNDKVDAGKRPSLNYTTAHLPKGSVRYLQRQFGFGHVWKNVERLRLAAGKTTAPAVPIGKYEYRIRVVARGRQVVVSRIHPLFSYGRVSYTDLCKSASSHTDCSSGAVQIGNTAFTYAEDDIPAVFPRYSQELSDNTTSCSSITVRWGYVDADMSNSYVKIIQSATDPQKGSTANGTIGKLVAKLDGGPFFLDSSADSNNADEFIYFNGFALCYTDNGLR
jgi:hypothetical protein